MKKQYKKPMTESVKVNLYNSILENGIGVVNNSTEVGDEGLAKEQGNFFDFDNDTLGDIWGEGESNDLWSD